MTRDYLYSLPVKLLIERGLDSRNELAIALALALDDCQHAIDLADQMGDTIADLEADNRALQSQIERLQMRLGAAVTHDANV